MARLSSSRTCRFLTFSLEILVTITACGMCRSDVQLVDGYFRKYADIPTPITLGHEITGVVHKLGSIVSKSSGFREGDHVVVVAGWPDGETALAVMKF